LEILSIPLLYLLGIGGWLLVKPLGIPVPALMGTILVVGGLRIADVGLPETPPGFEEVVQILLGLYVGSMISKDTLHQMRLLLLPSLVTMVWVLLLAFGGGWFLGAVTYLDPLTGVLGSSTGGLPEMTVIALATHADASVIVILQLVRIIAVIVLFPFLLRFFALDRRSVKETVGAVKETVSSHTKQKESDSRQPWLVVAAAAVGGGIVFLLIGVPAGGMVGSIAAVVTATVLGYEVQFSDQRVLGFLLVGVGIMVSDNMDPQVGVTLWSGILIVPVILSTVLTFISSFLLAGVLKRVSKWDFPTCFMAAAPAGLTVMTALAIQYHRDPMPVFVLHMARVLILKTAVPMILAFVI